jgi:hypothetical protein
VAITRRSVSSRAARQAVTSSSTASQPSAHTASMEMDALTVTPDERSRIIAGLAFFHGMTQATASDPWRQWQVAEAQIDSVLKAHTPEGVL